jgi:hypothetical protein
MMSAMKCSKFVVMGKAKKKRADRYDEKLAINGSFEGVIMLSVTAGKPATAPKPVRPPRKNKTNLYGTFYN